MATFNVSIPTGQIVDVTWPGTPTPNTGVFYVSAAPSPTGFATIGVLSNSLQIHGVNVGSTVVTIVTKNAVNVQFTDTINVTVVNSTPDATGSGMTISAPHA